MALIQVLLVDGTALHHRKASGIILNLFDQRSEKIFFGIEGH